MKILNLNERIKKFYIFSEKLLSLIPSAIYTSCFVIFGASSFHTLVMSNSIPLHNSNNFIFPLIKITGGVGDTGGKVLPALGSTVLRIIKDQATNSVLGTSVLDCIQDEGRLKLICTNNFDRGTSGFAIGDDAVTISYRVYYGRFN